MTLQRIHLDKIASLTRNLHLGRWVTLGPEILVEEGSVIAGRILGEKTVYNQLEDVHGRMSVLHDGDLIVGALGHRNALHGYEGVLPKAIQPGDRLQMLNLGGVIGSCVSSNPEVGPPFDVEVLGQVLLFQEFGSRVGIPATLQSGAVPVSSRMASPSRRRRSHSSSSLFTLEASGAGLLRNFTCWPPRAERNPSPGT